ncbi:MAG: isoprenyl transferase [Halanaerobiaceae bacterium]
MEIPSHVAIIMDGNGRWAQKRDLPRKEGHKKGVEVLKEIVKESKQIGISVLTVYAFSTENWKRPGIEVNFLMKLFNRTIQNQAKELHNNNVKVNIIGRRKKLPGYLVKKIDYIEDLTKDNNGLELNIAFNYGGRTEIIDAVRNIVNNNKNVKKENINEEAINQNLYNSNFPDVELLIRTGGEKRLSNFLLWEIAYAELYIMDKYWPDFTRKDLKRAVKIFSQRDRRFGDIR